MAASTPLLAHIHRLLSPSAVDLGSDAELVQRFVRDRDQAAFAVLVARHGPMVLRLCRRELGDVHAAEDACQAAFLVLARKAYRLRHPETLSSWLHGVAYRLALKARAAEVRRRQIETERLHSAPTPSAPDPLAEVSARELLAILDAELQRLPEKYRLPLILCCLEGRTQPEAARLLGWTPGAVKGRLERGRTKLQQRLLRRGVTLPAALLALEATANTASARLPALLCAAILRAASPAETASGISATVLALAEGSIGGIASAKGKLLSMLVLMLGVVAGGIGALVYPQLAALPQKEQQKAEAAPTAREAKQPKEQPQPRLDRYGDPLPQGAVARLGTLRFRHPFWVGGLAFTPDGKILASACWDGSVRLWDAATGKETRCFRCPPNPRGRGPTALLGVAISPGGKTLLAMGNQENTYVWDWTTGKELHCLTARGGSFGLALSPDGKTAAIGDGGGKVQLWEVETGKPIRQFGTGDRPIEALAFSPDSKILAAGDLAAIGAARPKEGASSIRLWDTAAGRKLRELKEHTGGVTALAFARDGRTLVSASHDATLRFWEPATGKQIRKIQVQDDTALKELVPDQHKGIDCGGVLSVAYSPDGRLLASGSYDGTVRLWNASTGKELHALSGHGREVASVVFSPDGKVLASGSRDHTIRLWDPSSGKQLRPRQGHDGPVNNLAVSPDGRVVAAVCHDNTIRLWDLATQRQRHVLRGHTDFVYAVAFSPDGRIVASASADCTVRFWDSTTGREMRQLPKHQTVVDSIAFTSVQNMVVSVEANGMLHFWDGATGEELRRIPNICSNHFFQLSSDGTILATAARNAVHLLDVKTGMELRRFGGAWPRFGLSPNGRTLVMQASSEKVRLWSITTGEELGILGDEDSPPGYAGVASYVFSPDGRLLARVGKGDLELWEVLTGKLRRRLRGHQAGIGPFAFSPDGKTLLSGSNDTTVLIWDVARQHERRSAQLSKTQLQGLWRDLSGNAEKADEAIGTLAAAAEQSLPFLKQHLQPARRTDEERLTRLIADLDDDQFAVRERAGQELERMGSQAEAALRQALKKAPSLEARRRMENLLAPLRGFTVAPELIHVLRAVEILERIGTAQSREVLKSLANGAPAARLTREAKAALERCRK